MNAGRNFGLFPDTIIASHGILFSSGIEVTIIAVALIDRIASIENEKAMAREKALLSERLATESRLRALQAQINPHFLFNTLNTIAEMTSVDPGKAERLVTRLSRLFRNTLSASVNKNVLLSEELEMIRTYLEIEKDRFGDRLNYAVAGTPNRLEYDQGFFVKLGDGAADVKPIAHLYKTQVYQLAEYLGVPEEIRNRPPTTDTYSLPQGQDEFYFSLPHREMDLCLYGKNQGYPAGEVAEVLGLTPEQVQRVYDDIEGKRNTTRYLHLSALLVEEVREIAK